MDDVFQKLLLEKSRVRLRQDFGGTSPKPVHRQNSSFSEIKHLQGFAWLDCELVVT